MEPRAPAGNGPSLRILIVYAQPVFWSMGEGRGAAIFSDLPSAIAAHGHEVRVSLPTLPEEGGERPEGPGGRAERGEDRTGEDHARQDRTPANGAPAELYRGFLLHRAPAGRSFVPALSPWWPARLYKRLACWTEYQRWGMSAARRVAAAHPPDLILGMGHFEAPVARRLAASLDLPNVTRLFGNSLSLALKDPLRFYANFPEIIALRTPADLVLLNDDGADGEAVAARLRIPPERIRHLRNGVDYDLFHPAPAGGAVRRRLGLDGARPLLLTVTRLAPEKMLDRAIRGLAGLLPLRPDAVLVLLGDGPERAPLMALARELGIEEHVLFPGPIVQRELPDWYRSADVVLSLLDRTNAANPVFEAMACGRFVLALDVATARRVIRDGGTGVLIAREDLPRLGPILAEWLGRNADRERIGGVAAEAIRGLVMHKQERLAHEVALLEEVVRLRRAGAAQAASGRWNGSERVAPRP